MIALLALAFADPGEGDPPGAPVAPAPVVVAAPVAAPPVESEKTVDARGDYPDCTLPTPVPPHLPESRTDVERPCGSLLRRIPSGMTYQEVVGSRATPPPAEE
jgi:hypothetical protein